MPIKSHLFIDLLRNKKKKSDKKQRIILFIEIYIYIQFGREIFIKV